MSRRDEPNPRSPNSYLKFFLKRFQRSSAAKGVFTDTFGRSTKRVFGRANMVVKEDRICQRSFGPAPGLEGRDALLLKAVALGTPDSNADTGASGTPRYDVKVALEVHHAEIFVCGSSCTCIHAQQMAQQEFGDDEAAAGMRAAAPSRKYALCKHVAALMIQFSKASTRYAFEPDATLFGGPVMSAAASRGTDADDTLTEDDPPSIVETDAAGAGAGSGRGSVPQPDRAVKLLSTAFLPSNTRTTAGYVAAFARARALHDAEKEREKADAAEAKAATDSGGGGGGAAAPEGPSSAATNTLTAPEMPTDAIETASEDELRTFCAKYGELMPEDAYGGDVATASLKGMRVFARAHADAFKRLWEEAHAPPGAQRAVPPVGGPSPPEDCASGRPTTGADQPVGGTGAATASEPPRGADNRESGASASTPSRVLPWKRKQLEAERKKQEKAQARAELKERKAAEKAAAKQARKLAAKVKRPPRPAARRRKKRATRAAAPVSEAAPIVVSSSSDASEDEWGRAGASGGGSVQGGSELSGEDKPAARKRRRVGPPSTRLRGMDLLSDSSDEGADAGPANSSMGADSGMDLASRPSRDTLPTDDDAVIVAADSDASSHGRRKRRRHRRRSDSSDSDASAGSYRRHEGQDPRRLRSRRRYSPESDNHVAAAPPTKVSAAAQLAKLGARLKAAQANVDT